MSKQQKTILIIGLGNPGDKFKETRHNFGFAVLDKLKKLLAKEMNQELGFEEERKFKSEICQINNSFFKVILVKPLTFINLSGEAAAIIKRFFKPDEIIVVYDDLNLNLGTIRLRKGGESGGHKGVKNIIQKIGSEFWRLKLGIGPQPQKLRSEKFVLQKFNPQEKPLYNQTAQKASALLFDVVQNKQKLGPSTIRI